MGTRYPLSCYLSGSSSMAQARGKADEEEGEEGQKHVRQDEGKEEEETAAAGGGGGGGMEQFANTGCWN